MEVPENPDKAAPVAAGAEPARRRVTRSTPLLVAAVVVLVLVILAVAWHRSSSRATVSATSTQYGAAGVSSVELDGINGTLAVGVGNSSEVSATAQPVDGRGAPGLTFHWNSATHVLALQCSDSNGGGAVAVPCPASTYAVLVPAHVGVTLREMSGQAHLVGLSGPVSITASSADTTVQGLRSADFTAAITSGTLKATFATAPTHVLVSVISAQASLDFPASASTSYDVIERTVSADIQVAIPQSSTSTRTVQVAATSGEISLGTSS